MSVKSIFSSAGFDEEQSRSILQFMCNSGSFKEKFTHSLFEHIQEKEKEKGLCEDERITGIRLIIYPSNIVDAVIKSSNGSGTIDLNKFSNKTSAYKIPDRFMLALIQASHQSHFLQRITNSEQSMDITESTIKENAKIINEKYDQIACQNEIKTPVDINILNNEAIGNIDQAIKQM